MRTYWGLLGLLAMVVLAASLVLAQGGHDPANQTASLMYDEARTVYRGNLARRDNGLPPLRWNRQLTYAARWFSWDSTENRSSGFCAYQDTNGNGPADRALAFGYLGSAGTENILCRYAAPEEVIQGWMDNPVYRANLLNSNWREVGLGYYRRDSDGRGYVTQDFGSDPVYAPVVIENEAPSTTTPNVGLYIYDHIPRDGFAGLSAATEIMVSNDACFADTAWEPYAANKAWTLKSGEGWRSVYVKTRDVFGRTQRVNDSIYLGANVPTGELGPEQLSTTQSQVTLYNLNGNGLPQVQFSLGWLADDSSSEFRKIWGTGEQISDAAAWGGTAYRLYHGGAGSGAWVWDDEWSIKDVPMVAYFRLKTNDNTSDEEIALIRVKGGGTLYGPVSLKGTDFYGANAYQEFALGFTYSTDISDDFYFQFECTAEADLYVDAVSIFGAAQPISSPMTWSIPGGNYRGQAIWARYTDGSQFSEIVEAATAQAALRVSPTTLTLLAVRDGSPPSAGTLHVVQDCSSFTWQASDNVPWLQTQVSGDTVRVQADQTGLSSGVHTGTVTISAVGTAAVQPVSVQVRLTVLDELFSAYLPLIKR
jgi:uncharacterized protein YkwD